MSNAYRFVHLSDIHFGQERDGTLVTHEDVREELLRDCRTQAADLGPAGGILITGDTAYSGQKAEYDRAGEWLDRLTEAVGCSKIAVSLVPGNHDVDLQQIDYMGQLAHKELRAANSTTIDAVLEGIASGNEASNPLLPKFAAYREFAARYGCDFESVKRPAWKKDYELDGRNILRFAGLNSVQVSNTQDAPGQMVLGNSQYVIPREDDLEYVILVHHPLHWLKDHLNAERYLRRARVVMVGHEHRLDIRKVQSDDGTEQLEIYAGATNPPGGSLYPYRYNWIEFELRSTTTEGVSLVVSVHPRVWEPTRTEFLPDRARLSGEASKSFSLACPALRSVNADETRSCIPDAPKAGEAMHVNTQVTQRNTSLAHDESEQFARLRYFFWKYLDWDERLMVLAELDLLPATASQPVPQTLERLALDNARAQGKLYELWTSVMNVVPLVKREVNPFAPKEG